MTKLVDLEKEHDSMKTINPFRKKKDYNQRSCQGIANYMLRRIIVWNPHITRPEETSTTFDEIKLNFLRISFFWYLFIFPGLLIAWKAQPDWRWYVISKSRRSLSIDGGDIRCSSSRNLLQALRY